MTQQFQIQKREEIIQKFQLMQLPDAVRACCLGCKNARLQINNKNKDELDEYPSPAIVKEYLRNLEITAVCVATGQLNKLGQISVCELSEGFE